MDQRPASPSGASRRDGRSQPDHDHEDRYREVLAHEPGEAGGDARQHQVEQAAPRAQQTAAIIVIRARAPSGSLRYVRVTSISGSYVAISATATSAASRRRASRRPARRAPASPSRPAAAILHDAVGVVTNEISE